MRTIYWLSCLFMATLISLPAHAQELWGARVKVGNGFARTYIEKSEGLGMTTIGYAFSESALTGLPEHQHVEYVLPLPAGNAALPFRNLTLNWNPHGHIPPGIYDKPHFDFHFYTITREQQLGITCRGSDAAICMRQPDAGLLPPSYAPTPEGEPLMGWHWVDTLSPEFRGAPFTATFIYGFYNGQISFVEPMVTLDFLRSRSDFTALIRRPARFPGFEMSHWTVEFDSKRGLYFVVMRR